jgi:phosphoglycolate phosphatase
VSGDGPGPVVCCGLIGTTVIDGGLMERAYAEAIATQGAVTGTADFARCMARAHRARGQPLAAVMQTLFPESEARAQAAQLAFEQSFREAIERTGLSPAPGAEQAIRELTEAGARVCLFTGLSGRLLALLLRELGWRDRADLVLSTDDVPRGCPWPDPILAAMLRLGVADVREAVVAHDTENGVLAGCRAGAGIVAGVLTGTHTAERLRNAGASYLLPSIAGLPELVSTAAAGDPARPTAPTAPASA